MSGFGDDQVGRAEDWCARHPGWRLTWPGFRARLGTEFERFRLVHMDTGTTHEATLLRDLLDDMDARCGVYGCAGDHGQPEIAVTAQQN